MAAEDQQRLARLATVSALLVVASFLAAKAARDAILLSSFSIKSFPLFTGLSAILSLPVIIIAGRLMSRWGPHRLVPWMNAVSGAVAIVEYLTIHQYPRAVAVIVFFHFNTASAVLVSGFWSTINERFDIHSAKRHIGRIGMGATLGGILGGVIAERTAVYLKPDAILIVLAGLQLVCAAMLAAFSRGAPDHPVETTESNWHALTGVWKSQLLRRAGLVVVLTAVGAGALDYVFKADIVGAGSKASLLRQLALFYTVTNVITAIVQVALSGPVLAWFGVPKSVATLPWTITGFGLISFLVPVPVAATIARGSELVMRNSIYRAGYELLYAPLPPEQKRPTKVILDVGADKLGDILAAQLVGAIVFLAADSRSVLLFATVVAGALAILVTIRLPRAYTKSLESSLMEAAAERNGDTAPFTQPEPWISLSAMPSFGHPGDAVPLQLRKRKRRKTLPPVSQRDVIDVIKELRTNPAAALAQSLPAACVPIAIDLLDRPLGRGDQIAKLTFDALRQVAARNTGALVDAMLDPDRSVTTRRRLTAIVAAGQPELAAWGLWHGMRDPSFDVRYHASTRLAALAGEVDLHRLRREEVFEYVRSELLTDRDEWKARKLERDPILDEADGETDWGLAHVFRVLGLVLPAEPLRVALHAVQTDDSALRGMALEYLESILPPDVRAQLWPLLDESLEAELGVAEPSPAHSTDLLAKMRESYEHHRVGHPRKHSAS